MGSNGNGDREKAALHRNEFLRMADDEEHRLVAERNFRGWYEEYAEQTVAGLVIPRLQTLPDAGGLREGPVIVAGEILVPDDAQLAATTRVLSEFGFQHERRIVVGDDRREDPAGVVVFAGPDEQLGKALEAADRSGLAAATHDFLTLKGVQAKGNVTPENTDTVLPPRRTSANGIRVPVAVVDVGLPADVHQGSGALLEDVKRGGDPIDNIKLQDLRQLQPPYLDPAAGHGAFVLGMVRQAYPDAPLGSFRALTGLGGGTEIDVVNAIKRATAWLIGQTKGQKNPRGVLNLSLGTQAGTPTPPLALELAINSLPDWIIVVASAGNERSDAPTWPAAFKRVLGISALNYDGDAPAEWSAFGHWVDFSIEGEGLVSTLVPGEENRAFDPDPDHFEGQPLALWSGTSFGAPYLSGWLARWMAEDSERSPGDAVNALRAKGTRRTGYGYAVSRRNL